MMAVDLGIAIVEPRQGQCVLIGSMKANWFRRAWAGLSPLAGLLLLCLLWSLGSMRSDLLPTPTLNLMPPMERRALPFAMLAVAAAVFAVARGAKRPRARGAGAAVLIGLGLFVAPAELALAAHGWTSELTRVALFSLAPLFAVVFEPYTGRGAGPQSRSGLLSALVAVAGTLLVFPVGIPGSIESGGAFCAVILAAACVAAANCGGVKMAHDLPGNSIASLAVIAGGTAATGFAAQSALTEQMVWKWNTIAPELAWSAAVELPALLLLFWLMRRMSATRMTTRFVLAPLMTILIGFMLQRPAIEPRTWLGLFLMTAGAVGILLAPEEEPEAGSSLLKLNRK